MSVGGKSPWEPSDCDRGKKKFQKGGRWEFGVGGTSLVQYRSSLLRGYLYLKKNKRKLVKGKMAVLYLNLEGLCESKAR